MTFLKNLLARLVLASLLLCHFGGAAQAAPLYTIHIDTATLGGGQAYLGLYFLGLADAAPATATVSGLSGAFAAPAQISGPVSGALPGALTFSNGGELVQSVSLGGVLSFSVSFTQGSGNSNAGTTFGWALFDETHYLGADGDLGTLALQPGLPVVVNNASPLSSVQAVPEPATVLMLSLGLLCIAWRVRRLG